MPKKSRKKKKRGRYHRGTYSSTKSGIQYNFRSGWEQKYMIHLDENPDVSSWTYEKLVIEYVSNQKTKKIRRYFPDFYVEFSDGSKKVIEIKQKRKLEQAIVKKKTTAAQAWCETFGATYVILTEIELKNMGLI
jgi:hypothetical protein